MKTPLVLFSFILFNFNLLVVVYGDTSKILDDVPLVTTSLGKIEGTILKTLFGKDIYAFKGIRYAKAPINELRFKAPEPEEPWRGTLKATSDSLICPQPYLTQDLMTEDCLKINVFTRNLTAEMAVMVYIHGGSNAMGSGHSLYEAGPQYLLDHDVVLVTFNYRLGALGFLSTKTSEYPGNYGYLDQVLALKWVQEHISHFGGDPERVTIFGISAGSMAVSLHLASPLSKGLFHRAIAMSGSATNHFHIDNLYWTRKLARELSCPQYNPTYMVDCLRKLSWKAIIDKCSEWEPYSFSNIKWYYEIDGIFLTQHPTKVFESGNFSALSLIVGFTRNELDCMVYRQENNAGLLNDLNVSFESYAPELFLYQDNCQNYIKSQHLKRFYLKDLEAFNSTNLVKIGNIFSDALIGHGTYRLVQLISKHQSVYYYRMDYVGARSVQNYPNCKPKGVEHADDLQYVMPGSMYGDQLSLSDPDVLMVKRLTQLWTSFAQNGVPQADDVPEWKPFQDNHKLVLYNDKTAYLSLPPNLARYQLWDDLFPIEES